MSCSFWVTLRILRYFFCWSEKVQRCATKTSKSTSPQLIRKSVTNDVNRNWKRSQEWTGLRELRVKNINLSHNREKQTFILLLLPPKSNLQIKRKWKQCTELKMHGNKRVKTRQASHRHAWSCLNTLIEYNAVMCMRELCFKNSKANKNIYGSANFGKFTKMQWLLHYILHPKVLKLKWSFFKVVRGARNYRCVDV